MGEVKFKKIFRKDIPNNSYYGKVIKVIDGDTVKVSFQHGEIKNVRLLLINSPEKKDMFGKQATEFASKVLLNKNVYIELDYITHDLFNRLLGYVWYRSNDKLYLFNHEIVLNSLSKVGFTYNHSKYIKELTQAQDQVKLLKKFIWEVPGYADNKKDKFDMTVYNTNSLK